MTEEVEKRFTQIINKLRRKPTPEHRDLYLSATVEELELEIEDERRKFEELLEAGEIPYPEDVQAYIDDLKILVKKIKLEGNKLSNSITTETDAPQSQSDLPTVQEKNILEPARTPLGEKQYLTIDELHEYTGIKKSTIYKMTSKGEIPFMKPKGRLIFKRKEIDKWLANH